MTVLTACEILPRLRAGVAQLVEYKLPKLGVAGSNPVARSINSLAPRQGVLKGVGSGVRFLMIRCAGFLLALTLILTIGFSSTVFAFRPFLETDSAVPLEKGASLLESGFKYERYSSPTANNYQLSAELTFGLLTNLEFEVEIPYVILKTDSIDNSGLGDVTLKWKLGLLKAREAIPLSLAAQLVVKLPTCDEGKLYDDRANRTCTGETDIGFVGLATKEFASVTVHLNLGYFFIGDPAGIDLKNVFRYSLGIQDHSILPAAITPMIELAGETQRNPSVNSDPISVLAGVGYDIGRGILLDAALSFGVTRASPDYSFTVGMTYHF